MIYFDNAASSLRSKNFVENYCKSFGQSLPPDQQLKILKELAEMLADYLNVDPNTIYFVPNATYGLNEIAITLTKNAPSREVFLSYSEHSSNHLIWVNLFGSNVQYFDLGSQVPIASSPSIFSFTLLSNLDGKSFDLTKLDLLEANIYVVDASQYMQHATIDYDLKNIDFLVFSAHKFFGPNGLGVVYAKDELTIGIGIQNFYEKIKQGYTLDFHGMWAWSVVLNEILELYKEGIVKTQEQKLLSYFLDNFPENKYVEIANKDTKFPIFLLRVKDPELTSKDYAFYLALNDLTVRSGLSCAFLNATQYDSMKVFRVSLSFQNTTSEIDALFSLIKKFSPESCFK